MLKIFNRQNIFVIIFLAVIIVGGYLFYVYYGSQAPQVGIKTVGGQTGAESANREFLKLLDTLEALKLDRSIFQEPTFQGLVDLSPEMAPRTQKGRTNPFKPF